MASPELITTAEAATRLRISRRRVIALIAAGRLPATQMGRAWIISAADLRLVRIRTAGYPKGKARTAG